MLTPSVRVQLLELLRALAGRAMTVDEFRRVFQPRAGDVGSALEALEALEAEGLVRVVLRDRGAVYAATPAGRSALESRGVSVAGTDAMVAIMFTDVVSSTELIESLGEAEAHAARRRHFALLRESVARHRGHEVKSLGDGLMVVFDRPVDALVCAQAMQRVVASDRDGLRLRVGIGAGSPLREGDDYFGTPVVIAKRLCDAARAGEILISDRLRELAGASARGGLRSRGSMALKGLGQPVAASAVVV